MHNREVFPNVDAEQPGPFALLLLKLGTKEAMQPGKSVFIPLVKFVSLARLSVHQSIRHALKSGNSQESNLTFTTGIKDHAVSVGQLSRAEL